MPVLGDARKHAAWGVLLPTKVPWLFQDVAQAGQVDISFRHVSFAARWNRLLSLKAASERWTGKAKPPCSPRLNARLFSGHDVEEVIELTGYEDNHRLFVVRAPEA